MSCSTFLPSILVHHTYFPIYHQFQEVNNNYVLRLKQRKTEIKGIVNFMHVQIVKINKLNLR